MRRFEDGRCVLVTGGARGLGVEIARRLAAEGARVLVGDVLQAEGAALAAEIGGAFVTLEVAREEDWRAALAEADRFGGLRGLVNNAGIYIPKPILETVQFRVGGKGFATLGWPEAGWAVVKVAR